MSSNNSHINESVRFVAKHYKPNTFDPPKGWEKLSASIPELGETKKVRLFPRIAAVAAIVIFVIGIGILMMPKSETLVAKVDHTQFTLPDNSQIEMQQGAELKYNRDFGESERNVSMLGKISFAVVRDETRPFIVATPAAQIRVLGTEFTVIADDEETRLSVESGKVQLTPNSPAIPLLCTAGMRVHYTAKTENIEVTSPESSMQINGKNESLAFNNSQLKDVALILSHFYNVQIDVLEEEASLTFTSSFTQKSVIEIINIINLTLDTHLTINN